MDIKGNQTSITLFDQNEEIKPVIYVLKNNCTNSEYYKMSLGSPWGTLDRNFELDSNYQLWRLVHLSLICKTNSNNNINNLFIAQIKITYHLFHVFACIFLGFENAIKYGGSRIPQGLNKYRQSI